MRERGGRERGEREGEREGGGEGGRQGGGDRESMSPVDKQ